MAQMSIFERYLTIWVFLCIVTGIASGQVLPGFFQAIGQMEVAKVNLPIGLLIWVMIIPMLLRIDFGALHQLRQHWRGIGVTLFVNWAIKPFSMALLGWFFIRHVFADALPSTQLDSYLAGLILLAAAPCTAMVFVWSRLTQGHPLFTLSQVALNDIIMVFAFAPIVALLLGLSSIAVPLRWLVREHRTPSWRMLTPHLSTVLEAYNHADHLKHIAIDRSQAMALESRPLASHSHDLDWLRARGGVGAGNSAGGTTVVDGSEFHSHRRVGSAL